MERVGRQGPLAVAAGGEGCEAGTAVGAVVVAGGEGWEAGAIVVAVGRVGRQQPLLPSSATAAELRAAQVCLCVGQ